MKTVKYPILKPVSYDRLEQTYNTVCNYIGCILLGSVTTEEYAYCSQKITFDPCPVVQLPIERKMKVKTKKTEFLPEKITDKMYEFKLGVVGSEDYTIQVKSGKWED